MATKATREMINNLRVESMVAVHDSSQRGVDDSRVTNFYATPVQNGKNGKVTTIITAGSISI